MSAFETWASGLLDWEYQQDLIHHREAAVAKILPADELQARWERIKYSPPQVKPPTGQLKMEI